MHSRIEVIVNHRYIILRMHEVFHWPEKEEMEITFLFIKRMFVFRRNQQFLQLKAEASHFQSNVRRLVNL